MSDAFQGLPTVRHLVQQPPLIQVEAPSMTRPAPTEDQALAAEGVFSESGKDRSPTMDAITLAAASMLLRDVVVDTLAEPEEVEEETPKAKKKPKSEA